MQRAPVNRIIDFSLEDGPSNRTAIFLQGCNFSCSYCHSPETQRLCVKCGRCVSICPSGALSFVDGSVVWEEGKCCACDGCIKACSHRASPRIRYLNAQEVMRRVEKNRPFIRGITVSGGECTLYPDFLKELFFQAKEAGLTTLMDTNGSFDFSAQPELLDHCDGILLDLKACDPAIHQKVTGTDGGMVWKTLQYAAEWNKLSELRTVCLPGAVDAEAVIHKAADILGSAARSVRYKLIAFRPLGVRGKLRNTPQPGEAYLRRLEQTAREAGFENIVLL